MSQETYDPSTNTTTFVIEDPSAFSAFSMYRKQNDPRQLDRTPETTELKACIGRNLKSSQIVVNYGNAYIPLSNR